MKTKQELVRMAKEVRAAMDAAEMPAWLIEDQIQDAIVEIFRREISDIIHAHVGPLKTRADMPDRNHRMRAISIDIEGAIRAAIERPVPTVTDRF